MINEPGKKGTLQDRYEKLDRTGRRCFGSDRRCERNAMFIVTVQPCDPETGELHGEPEKRRACPRHRKFLGNDDRSGLRVLEEVELPPITLTPVTHEAKVYGHEAFLTRHERRD